MLELLRTRRGRAGIAVLMSVAVAIAWVVAGQPTVLLPGIMLALWFSVFAGQEPASPRARLMLVVAGGLVVLLGVGALLLFIAAR